MLTKEELDSRGWKLPRGFWWVGGRAELIPHGEEGFDPNAANVNLEQYFADLADREARFKD